MKTGLCGLYCFKNKQGEIIYIGRADDIHKRLKSHEHLPEECYNEINSIEYAIVTNKADRDILETLFISQLNPKYNIKQKYNEKASLIIDSTIMLLWQKANPAEYNFIEQHQKYINKKKNNTHIKGRPKIELPDKFYDLYPRWKNGEITATSLMKEIGLERNTFYRRVKEYEATLINE